MYQTAINWDKIKIIMAEQKIRTDRELARRCGIHENTVGKCGTFQSATLDRLANGLGKLPSELITVHQQ